MQNILRYSDKEFINDYTIITNILKNCRLFLLDLFSGDRNEDYRLINPKFVKEYRKYRNQLRNIILNRFVYLNHHLYEIIRSGKVQFYEIFSTCGLSGIELKFKSRIIEILFHNIYNKSFNLNEQDTIWNKLKDISIQNIPANIIKIKKLLDNIKDLLNAFHTILLSIGTISLHAYAIDGLKQFIEKILKRK